MNERPEIRVLLVEDNPGDARFYQEMLKENSSVRYTCTVAQNLAQATAFLNSSKYGIIILDLNLPDSGGIETLERIIGPAGIIPVIVLTGVDDETIGTKAIEHGAEDYLIKGAVSSAQLSRSIRYAMERKKMLRELQERERQWRTTFNSISDSICILDIDGRIINHNSVTVAMLGKTPEEFRNKHCFRIMHGTSEPNPACPFQKMKSSSEREQEIFLKEDRWIECTVDPMLDDDGKIIGGVHVMQDITERKRAEDLVLEANKNLRMSEIATLNMLEDLKVENLSRKTSEQLLQSEQRYLKESQVLAKIGHWEYDITGQTLMTSDQVYVLFERDSTQGPLSKEDANHYFASDEMIKFSRNVSESLRVKEQKSCTIVALCPSGKKVLSISVQPIVDENGSVIRLFGTVQDISERVAAEGQIQRLLAERELLLKEVHHRIKNNMNTMMSILSLLAESLQEPAAVAALRDARNRMQSMEVLYDKLYRTEQYGEISVLEYFPPLIEEIAGMFPNRPSVQIDTQIDDFVLDVKTLSSLGIIINELLTNAMKHAFNGRNDGRILVTASIHDNDVLIVIKDDGIGMLDIPDAKAPTGFGLQLVGLLVTQLGGSYKIETEKGCKFILNFKQ
jgi:PAS domain S-box-containing protein